MKYLQTDNHCGVCVYYSSAPPVSTHTGSVLCLCHSLGHCPLCLDTRKTIVVCVGMALHACVSNTKHYFITRGMCMHASTPDVSMATCPWEFWFHWLLNIPIEVHAGESEKESSKECDVSNEHERSLSSDNHLSKSQG